MGWYIVADQKNAKNERKFGSLVQSDPLTVDQKKVGGGPYVKKKMYRLHVLAKSIFFASVIFQGAKN